MRNSAHKLHWPAHYSGLLIAIVLLVVLTLFCEIVGYPLVIPALLVLSGFHLVFAKKVDARRCLHVGLLMTMMVVTADVMTRLYELSPFCVPVPSIVMLVVVLFGDIHLAFVVAFVSSVIVAMIAGGDYRLMLLYFMGGMAGGYVTWNARTRGQFIRAFLVIVIVYVMGVIMEYPYPGELMSQEFLRQQIFPLIINAFVSSFVVLATLRVFEHAFGVITNYTLLELSDFKHPLLKRMISEAPGTYQHSLAVSQLAEAAADEVGANGLLCRVGGYYHDIGKLVTPEYFTENQNAGLNKHDQIEPTMSRLVILSHVKEGVELGKKYHLNPVILSFIPEHHGTSLIHYFYHKSMEDADVGEVIDEQDFRYPGPKPQTPETAIVMLADSVEGAVRAMDDHHTPSRIETTVQKIINNKFIDGQLDECSLTLKDINRIAQSFTRILSAIYHSRIKYPDADK